MEMKLHCFFYVISAIASYVEYMKTRVENLHLYLLQMEVSAKLMHGDIMLFPYRLKTTGNKGFLMFSGGIERVQ